MIAPFSFKAKVCFMEALWDSLSDPQEIPQFIVRLNYGSGFYID